MTVKNPGSFNEFSQRYPNLSSEESVAAYTGELAIYWASVSESADVSGVISPDFLLIQTGTINPGGEQAA